LVLDDEIMSPLFDCPFCSRAVRAHELECPFCGFEISKYSGLRAVPTLPLPGLNRGELHVARTRSPLYVAAAMVPALAAALATAPSCTAATVTLYGAGSIFLGPCGVGEIAFGTTPCEGNVYFVAGSGYAVCEGGVWEYKPKLPDAGLTEPDSCVVNDGGTSEGPRDSMTQEGAHGADSGASDSSNKG
jgi:hypothetical protein